MASYRVTQTSFIGNTIREEGAIVTDEDLGEKCEPHSSNLELIEDAPKAPKGAKAADA